MADFCRACSIDMFNKDFREMAGLCPDDPDAVAGVTCEGCGPILVNHAGECVSTECLCKGQEGHGVRHAAFTDKDGNPTPTPRLVPTLVEDDDGTPAVTLVPYFGDRPAEAAPEPDPEPRPRGWTPDDL